MTFEVLMGTMRRALIVGIENYQTLNKLDYACNDANAITAALKEYECQFDCITLLDEEAKVSKIRNSFKEMFHEADDNAVLIFFSQDME